MDLPPPSSALLSLTAEHTAREALRDLASLEAAYNKRHALIAEILEMGDGKVQQEVMDILKRYQHRVESNIRRIKSYRNTQFENVFSVLDVEYTKTVA